MAAEFRSGLYHLEMIISCYYSYCEQNVLFEVPRMFKISPPIKNKFITNGSNNNMVIWLQWLFLRFKDYIIYAYVGNIVSCKNLGIKWSIFFLDNLWLFLVYWGLEDYGPLGIILWKTLISHPNSVLHICAQPLMTSFIQEVFFLLQWYCIFAYRKATRKVQWFG